MLFLASGHAVTIILTPPMLILNNSVTNEVKHLISFTSEVLNKASLKVIVQTVAAASVNKYCMQHANLDSSANAAGVTETTCYQTASHVHLSLNFFNFCETTQFNTSMKPNQQYMP